MLSNENEKIYQDAYGIMYSRMAENENSSNGKQINWKFTVRNMYSFGCWVGV